MTLKMGYTVHIAKIYFSHFYLTFFYRIYVCVPVRKNWKILQAQTLLDLVVLQVIRMLFVIVAEFFICWAPLHILNTWYLFYPEDVYKYVGSTGISLVHLLAYVSSCCNPITYCFMNKKFRQAFLTAFNCGWVSFVIHMICFRGIPVRAKEESKLQKAGPVPTNRSLWFYPFGGNLVICNSSTFIIGILILYGGVFHKGNVTIELDITRNEFVKWNRKRLVCWYSGAIVGKQILKFVSNVWIRCYPEIVIAINY